MLKELSISQIAASLYRGKSKLSDQLAAERDDIITLGQFTPKISHTAPLESPPAATNPAPSEAVAAAHTHARPASQIPPPPAPGSRHLPKTSTSQKPGIGSDTVPARSRLYLRGLLVRFPF